MDLNKLQFSLKQYMEIESVIQDLEQSNPLTVFYVKKSQLDQLESKIKEHEEHIRKTCLQLYGTETVSDLSEFHIPQHFRIAEILEGNEYKIFNKKFQDQVSSVNNIEIAITELEMLQQEKGQLGKEVAELFRTLTQLDEAYQIQENILEGIGIVQNPVDDSKEAAELIEIESSRVTISETNERWKEARIQLIEICAQFSMVQINFEEVNKFSQDTTFPQSWNGRGRQEIGEEIRDRLVSIAQNLEKVVYLLKIDLPYCKETEMTNLKQAMVYLFVDLQTLERKNHAITFYTAFHKRALALLIWIDKTIVKVIQVYLNRRTEEMNEKVKKLSQIYLKSVCETFPSFEWSKPPMLPKSPRPGTNIEEDLFEKLDSISKKYFIEFKFHLLSKIPTEEILFNETKDKEATIEDKNIQKTTAAKKRANRITRKASMLNLNELITSDIEPN